MMSIADLDGDGKMRLSEFCKLMEQLVPIINKRPRRKVESLSLGTKFVTNTLKVAMALVYWCSITWFSN